MDRIVCSSVTSRLWDWMDRIDCQGSIPAASHSSAISRVLSRKFPVGSNVVNACKSTSQ